MEQTDSWAGFGSEYIKAIEVKNNTDEYVITGYESRQENNKQTLLLNIERNEIKKVFGCNATNLQTVQTECPNKPSEVIGRIITFNKVQVQNPQTKQMVDGLRLVFKPKAEPEETVIDTGVNDDGTI